MPTRVSQARIHVPIARDPSGWGAASCKIHSNPGRGALGDFFMQHTFRGVPPPPSTIFEATSRAWEKQRVQKEEFSTQNEHVFHGETHLRTPAMHQT
uniref:Uncharacterized protein n=1 Tax=Lutzomyia longipalpis TaxID=7200 RepID=A0A1B0CFN7_LUTLO